ncbi:C45 family autoproteolytic acyltransferase/hydolase [Christiangramia salexigens]|uniref:Acyl-CoA--6-aminopenicillanic acid acyl-transferase n=1 Tax=Christiangramia salexigens TaxID=1913577 RepID=A0A1L3J324_9FLAO|nr:C45 family autoproteolytic acyltransferase/hydolase [Christiangramia salexigens]APG59515.1 acyl-CoA--6-aminopenicillanic acid acyl-transferase [Christiangramia salexigens]
MRSLYFLPLLLLLNSCGIKKSVEYRPDISGIQALDTSRIKHSSTHFSLGKNQLIKNKYGVWELYLEGNALERGIANGSLSRELIHHQETAFMNKLQSMVPSEDYRGFLKKMILWFNRKMYLHVPEEYQQEIYAVSKFGLEKYDSFAPAYLRMLYFHGAHDIGHALQDLMLVGCTSFAAWGEKTEDGELLIGRNFDFYAGDDFNEQKIVAFIKPETGNKFMMYTWGGFIGAVSGMNEKGISVTINAGKSRIPLIAKTPISLVAREILQYASSIDEAIEIARSREVFVSESIMVGSGDEKKAVLIEVAPSNFGVYEVNNSNKLICSNHFQSKAYSDDRRNLKTIEESHTKYRYDRMEQLIAKNDKLNEIEAVEILRNMKGLDDEELGFGNELAINQLLAHHGIVFRPKDRKVWVSANPYQMGEFIAYDLNDVFDQFESGILDGSVSNSKNTIPASKFIETKQFRDYEAYRKLEFDIKQRLEGEMQIKNLDAAKLVQLNPEFWEAHFLAGMIYYKNEDYKKAIIQFKQASIKEVTTLKDKELIEKMLRKSYRKLN